MPGLGRRSQKVGNVRPISQLLEDELEKSGNQSAEVRRMKRILEEQGGAVTVSRETYLKWLSGHSIPGDQYIPLLAEYLGRPIGDISVRLTWLRANDKGVVIDLGDLTYAPVAQVRQPLVSLAA